jgi:MSHA biogenesis protein MshI
MQWFNRNRGKALTAIRHTEEMTYIAQVLRKEHAKPFVNFAEVEINPMQSVADVKKLVQKYTLDQTPVSYVLEYPNYQIVQVEKPKVPDNELKEAIRWSLKDLVTTPVEDITLDIIDIPKNGVDDIAYVYVVFSPNKVIAELSNRLIDANMQLKTIEARMMAQRNIANLLAAPEQGEAMISFSHTGALLTFTHQGEICNARFIELDVNRADSYEKISLEIQRSLDGFESKFRNVFIKKLLVAPFSVRDSFCNHLREAIYTKIETFELEDIFDFSPKIDLGDMSRQASFFDVLGAALREEVPA